MKIGLIQINNTLDIDINIKTIKSFIETKPKIKYFILPENALTGYTSDVNELMALTLKDEKLLSLIEYCKHHKIHLFVGAAMSIKNVLYNCYLHIHKTVEIYKKTHLGIKEATIYEPGNELNVFKTDELSSGTCICIESHIPDIAQTYVLNGANCLMMPFASPSACGTREKLWAKYLPARAYDNGVYVLAVNLTGTLNDVSFTGGILALDPKGNVIDSYYEAKEHMVVIDMETTLVDKRKIGKTNYLKRRRESLYERKQQ